jgi:toxin ParE1/3/4
MSAPERTVIVSPDAQVDLADILIHTAQQWGEEQRDRYEATLVQAISGLADYPESGARRERLFPGCRVRLAGRHVIYYRIADDIVEVVRILHASTDPARHIRR